MKREKIYLPTGETLETVEIIPKSSKTDIPVFWLCGWGQEPTVYMENIVLLSNFGRTIIALNSPHGINLVNSDKSFESQSNIPNIELKRVSALITTLDKKNISQTDIVAHSRGAITAVVAASIRPDLFRNIVLIEPAGLVGKDTSGRLIRGALIDLIHQFGTISNKFLITGKTHNFVQTYTSVTDFINVFLSGPYNTIKSINTIAHTQIDGMLNTLKINGINISIIHGINDSFLPMARVQQQIKPNMLYGFYSVVGGHTQMYFDPQNSANLINQALDSLETIRLNPSYPHQRS